MLSASGPKHCQTTLFAFFYVTKLSVDRLVAISCSHSRTRALVPRPSSTAHARLLCFQYTDNVIEAAVRLSPTQIIAELLNYRDTAQLYCTCDCCYSNAVCRVGEHQHWLAHQCSICEDFHIYIECEITIQWDMGWGIHGLYKWVGHLWLKWVGHWQIEILFLGDMLTKHWSSGEYLSSHCLY